MSESTARAERFETRSPATPFYIWDEPQQPAAVRVSLETIERLEREVVAGFRSVSARGSEVGGLLLGRVVPGPRPVVSVEAYEMVHSEYSRGPLYRLSETDLQAFDAACRRSEAREDGLAVVGAFRGHTRKDLALDREDAALLAGRFGEAEKVFLLVKPFATKPAKARLFVWKDGEVQDASPVEIPFTRAELVAAGLVRAVAVEGAPAPPETTPDAAPPQEARRAQVVPIARRREPAAPEAGAESESKNTEAPASSVEAPAPEPAFTGFHAEEPVSKRGRKLVWITGGLAVAALLMILLVYPGLLIDRGPAPADTGEDTSSLALRVERSAGQLLLTWNREAEAVRAATRAVLSISDGPQQENVELGLEQLRNGSVVYSPLTSDVSFRLEVIAANQEKSTSEHVRVLGTRPSPMSPPPGAEVAQSEVAATTETAAAAGTPAAGEEETETTAEAAEPRESLSAKWRQPESLGQRLRPALPSELPPALRTAAISGPPAVGLPLPQTPAAPAVAPPPPPAPSAAPRPEAPAVRVGGQVRNAQLISRVEPVYPTLARQTRVQGRVELEATVARDGTVKNVRVVSGHPLLAPAAVEAVKRWRYRPTLLNGEAVEVTTRVAVGFSL